MKSPPGGREGGDSRVLSNFSVSPGSMKSLGQSVLRSGKPGILVAVLGFCCLSSSWCWVPSTLFLSVFDKTYPSVAFSPQAPVQRLCILSPWSSICPLMQRSASVAWRSLCFQAASSHSKFSEFIHDLLLFSFLLLNLQTHIFVSKCCFYIGYTVSPFTLVTNVPQEIWNCLDNFCPAVFFFKWNSYFLEFGLLELPPSPISFLIFLFFVYFLFTGFVFHSEISLILSSI